MFSWLSFHKYNKPLLCYVILVLLLLTITFFLFKSIIFFACSLEDHKTFLCNLFRDIKYVCSLSDQMPKLLTLNIYKKYESLYLKCYFVFKINWNSKLQHKTKLQNNWTLKFRFGDFFPFLILIKTKNMKKICLKKYLMKLVTISPYAVTINKYKGTK